MNAQHADLADHLDPMLLVSNRLICQFRIEAAPSAHERLLLAFSREQLTS